MSALLPDRLRIGDCLVDVPLREIHSPHARRAARVTPKAMGVLLVLVRQPGRVVGRDALLAEVWAGTLPTDDVVTQAVTQLRRAFGERRGETRYIETIAKGGYRLVAEVEVLAPPPADAAATVPAAEPPAPTPSPAPAQTSAPTPADAAPAARPVTVERTGPHRRPGRRALEVLAVLALVAVALAAAFWSWRSTVPGPVPSPLAAEPWLPPSVAPGRPYRLITSAPGFEFGPSLSPDAAMVAYAGSIPGRRGTALYVQTTQPTTPLAITAPPLGASDRHPAWSPDGREIAFQRLGPGEACSVRIIPANGGPTRKVADCRVRDALTFSWAPEGRRLLFGSMSTPQGPSGLRELDLETGRWRAIRYRTSAREMDAQPRYSPDGRRIVFVRNPPLGDLWSMPAEGGEPRPLTGQRVEIRGWDWLPGGNALVYGQRVDLETRIIRLDLRTGEQRDLGVAGAQMPSVAGRSMAFVHRQPEFGLFRVPRKPSDGAEGGERLFASSGRDVQPAISPDGRQLVFTSDRSGQFSLWWADLDEPGSLRMIESVRPDTRRLPEWSWDSRRVLVVGDAPQGGRGVLEIAPASGQIRRLPVPGGNPIQALYLPDPQRLLVGGGEGGGQIRLTLYDRSRLPWRALATLDDVSLAKVDPIRRRVLFTRLSDDGLWAVDLDLDPASVVQLDADAPQRWGYRNWDIASDGRIHYLESTADCLSSVREIAAARPGPPRCLRHDRLFATNGFSVSGRRDALFLPLAVRDGSDIAFMPLPPAPQHGVPGWIK